MENITYYPTYEEMLYPEKVDESIRKKAIKALKNDELNPINLFNITWKDENNQVRKLILPKELTGVQANIIVLLGNDFPSGSHKVGPAYSTLIESYVDRNMMPKKHSILAPSTGNFGIGAAYVCKLMGYDSIVVMPENMSIERHDRIQKYGGKLFLTPSAESDITITLQKTYNLAKNNQSYRVLAQFEFFSNYRFHRYVTGNSALEAAKGIGNSKIACFCSAPGSGGTLAAGDEIKKVFPECFVTAVEPYECSTLANGRRGYHRIEGIGDKMCTLIHNVLNTDYIACVKEKDAMLGFKLIHDFGKVLQQLGLSNELTQYMQNLFGPSGICNILAAIKMAQYLNLGSDDNIVTVATDGFDRYGSILEKLNKEFKSDNDSVIESWVKSVFSNQNIEEIYDFRSKDSKERLYKQKEQDWLQFGHSQKYLNSMRDMSFWDNEYAKIKEYNQKILQIRNKHTLF